MNYGVPDFASEASEMGYFIWQSQNKDTQNLEEIDEGCIFT